MALFLNTPKLSFWINRLIQESKKELILIVPYIKTSAHVFESLKSADRRGVEITIIYREEKLTDQERSKISSIENLNLLHHPNVHCKCYYNGELIIISSMNLYEYSEKNNREMGILLHMNDIDRDGGWFFSSDDKRLFDDAISEIREIINGAHLEKLSPHQKLGEQFTIDIVKTEEEIAYERCKRINKYFLNKIFKPVEVREGSWYSVCHNYFDKVDVSFESNRVSIDINLPDEELSRIFKAWTVSYNEFEFKGFKYYWNYHSSSIYLYQDSKFPWEEIKDDRIYHRKIKQGIDSIIKRYREVSKK